MNRRNFLLTTTATGLLVQNSWAQNFINPKQPTKFLFVLLRGGIDGLNVVVPTSSSFYYDIRPHINIPRDKTLPLNHDFGLHPSLISIAQLNSQKQASFIHCSGTPNLSRSHFETQSFIEMGCDVNNPSYSSGFLNRLSETLGKNYQSNSFTNNIPQIFKGKSPIDNVKVESNSKPRQNESDYEQLYQNSKMKDLVKRGFEQESKVYEMNQSMEQEMMAANGKANNINGFSKKMQRTAQYMSSPNTSSIGFIDVGGWDTHVNEGSDKGQLSNNLKSLDEGLGIFSSTLGTGWKNTLVVVMSEFGRTAKENGTQGTDHGHGNAMMILGGLLSKSGMQGKWDGLTPNSLNENRDLKVLTDYRNLLRSNLSKLYELNSSQMDYIFPNSKPESLILV